MTRYAPQMRLPCCGAVRHIAFDTDAKTMTDAPTCPKCEAAWTPEQVTALVREGMASYSMAMDYNRPPLTWVRGGAYRGD